MYSDSLQGREQQLEIKKYMQEIERKREQFYHEETMVFLSIFRIKFEREMNKRGESKRKKRQKIKSFRKILRNSINKLLSNTSINTKMKWKKENC